MVCITHRERREKRGISTLLSETDSDVSNTSIGDSSGNSHSDDSSFCADESARNSRRHDHCFNWIFM